VYRDRQATVIFYLVMAAILWAITSVYQDCRPTYWGEPVGAFCTVLNLTRG
jgi:hypothetical protein